MRCAAIITMSRKRIVSQVSTAGVILVGGKSSRMGSNKALLPWQGRRLVDGIADILDAAGIADIYVSGIVDGFNTIPDLLPHQGPVGGICASVMQLVPSYARLVFVPVDMPLLSTDCLHALLDDDGTSDAQHFDGHPLPCLLALNERTLAYTRHVQQHITNGGSYSVKRYLEGLKTRALPVPMAMERDLTNTNTPEEWQEATHEPAYQ
jgi:molybdopterin-guanine dinucleotide biosynthesis protein A